MKRLPFLLLLAIGLAPLASWAQAPAATTPAAVAYEYETASINKWDTREWRLIDTDPTHSRSQWYVQNERGKDRLWKSQAEVLNYLASQGWEILPLGVSPDNTLFHYMLRRPAK
ncbi:hypothetical protein [Hymenobacter wooponensis]|uniref:DUF4177 domain-containing protein n=1 Tax=Hymenobacter wooponensis TaxID=1525360 RepID=A0A4Z0MCR3_9BACT|nr:hypothetical protein [Hymenobacter wooponensis]TGD77170.1 hypothetical protein EU557_24370 [Hymenobacter wooponensis]